MYTRMEITISIDENIWQKVKIEAEKRNISSNELVKQALATFLAIDNINNPKLFGDIEE